MSQSRRLSPAVPEYQQGLVEARLRFDRQLTGTAGVEVADRDVVVRRAGDVRDGARRYSVGAARGIARPRPQLGAVGRVGFLKRLGPLGQRRDRDPIIEIADLMQPRALDLGRMRDGIEDTVRDQARAEAAAVAVPVVGGAGRDGGRHHQRRRSRPAMVIDASRSGSARIGQQGRYGVQPGGGERGPRTEQGRSATDRELPSGRVDGRDPAARIGVEVEPSAAGQWRRRTATVGCCGSTEPASPSRRRRATPARQRRG